MRPYADIRTTDEPNIGVMITYDGEDLYLTIELMFLHIEFGVKLTGGYDNG